jgi:uncharacterized membrane protein YbhN (UPF0104 family)
MNTENIRKVTRTELHRRIVDIYASTPMRAAEARAELDRRNAKLMIISLIMTAIILILTAIILYFTMKQLHESYVVPQYLQSIKPQKDSDKPKNTGNNQKNEIKHK